MYILGFLLLLCDMSNSITAPVDAMIVQIQQWGVVGAEQVMDQVLLNGVSLTGTSEEFDRTVRTISADVLLPALISLNQSSAHRNHTILRSCECIQEGSELHWNEHVFFDGEIYLTRHHTDTWTAHEPQALAIKALWEEELQRTNSERMLLQEGCAKLMRELRLSEEQSVPGPPLPQFLIPVFASLAFTGLVIISLVLAKNHGLRNPGGVIGSIIHYPKDMTEMDPEIKGAGYRTL